MRFSTLDQWLAWQEALHPRSIELGLERVRRVWARMGGQRPAPCVVTVAGTNGKGSSVALLEAVLRAAGWRVGAYTSPHLLRYNERVRIAGEEAGDALFCRAFDRVDEARGETSLTYFEFATLAALDIFAAADLDVALLEVGMGGRLDAVNIIDADVALVTAVDLDHRQWLGPDREAIGREKAGIFRPGRPAVVSDPVPPGSLLAHARDCGALLSCLGEDYGYQRSPGAAGWDWWSAGRRFRALPLPALPGAWQLQNAAGVLMVVERLRTLLPVDRDAIEAGLRDMRLPGRCQHLVAGDVSCIVDVAHNPQATAVLADELRRRPVAGHTHAVCALLADKEIARICEIMAPAVDVWHVAGLPVARAASPAVLQAVLRALGAEVRAAHDSVAAAFRDALTLAGRDDRIVVFGSFHTAAAVLALLAEPAFGLQSDSP